MKIRKITPDGVLLEQYGNKYIHLNTDVTLQVKITDEEFEKVLNGSLTMAEAIRSHDRSPKDLQDALVKDYLRAVADCPAGKIEETLAKLKTYDDLFSEFYGCVLWESVTENGIVVEGLDAAHLTAEFLLSPLEAYTCLTMLRETKL